MLRCMQPGRERLSFGRSRKYRKRSEVWGNTLRFTHGRRYLVWIFNLAPARQTEDRVPGRRPERPPFPDGFLQERRLVLRVERTDPDGSGSWLAHGSSLPRIVPGGSPRLAPARTRGSLAPAPAPPTRLPQPGGDRRHGLIRRAVRHISEKSEIWGRTM
jgi:hypothetical protein